MLARIGVRSGRGDVRGDDGGKVRMMTADYERRSAAKKREEQTKNHEQAVLMPPTPRARPHPSAVPSFDPVPKPMPRPGSAEGKRRGRGREWGKETRRRRLLTGAVTAALVAMSVPVAATGSGDGRVERRACVRMRAGAAAVRRARGVRVCRAERDGDGPCKGAGTFAANGVMVGIWVAMLRRDATGCRYHDGDGGSG